MSALFLLRARHVPRVDGGVVAVSLGGGHRRRLQKDRPPRATIRRRDAAPSTSPRPGPTPPGRGASEPAGTRPRPPTPGAGAAGPRASGPRTRGPRAAAAARIGSAWPTGGTRAGRASAGAASFEVAPRRAATAPSPVACGARHRRRPAGRPRQRGAGPPPRLVATRPSRAPPGTRRPAARAAAPRAARDDRRERPDRAPPVEALDRGGLGRAPHEARARDARLREAPPDLDALRRRHVERVLAVARVVPTRAHQLSTSAAGVDSVQRPALRKASRIAAKSEASPRIVPVVLVRRGSVAWSHFCPPSARLCSLRASALQSSVRGVKRELAAHDSRSSLSAPHKDCSDAPTEAAGSLRYERDAALPLGSATKGSHQCATCGAKLLKSKNRFAPPAAPPRGRGRRAVGPIGAALDARRRGRAAQRARRLRAGRARHVPPRPLAREGRRGPQGGGQGLRPGRRRARRRRPADKIDRVGHRRRRPARRRRRGGGATAIACATHTGRQAGLGDFGRDRRGRGRRRPGARRAAGGAREPPPPGARAPRPAPRAARPAPAPERRVVAGPRPDGRAPRLRPGLRLERRRGDAGDRRVRAAPARRERGRRRAASPPRPSPAALRRRALADAAVAEATRQAAAPSDEEPARRRVSFESPVRREVAVMAAAPVAVAAAAKKHHHAARKKPKPPPPPPRSKDASFDAKLSKIREAIAARETQQQPAPAPPSLRREVAVAHAAPTTPVAPAKRHHHATRLATSSGTHKPTGRMQRRAAREVPPDPAPVAAPAPPPEPVATPPPAPPEPKPVATPPAPVRTLPTSSATEKRRGFRRCRVVHDFAAEHESELKVAAGDVVLVRAACLKKMGRRGVREGGRRGRRGRVPHQHVRELVTVICCVTCASDLSRA